ncbi:hypothetical protein ACA910_006047 [Epithemia clementina (nom. ined.)]
MPKFSTVQAYSDNNSNVQTVSYQQAIGGEGKKAEKAKTEKIVNAYGSTAGANSGEFHVYRQARAREMARMESLRLQQEEQKKNEELQRELIENQQREMERTNKRRKKRQRHKEAKKRRQNLQKAGVILDSHNDDDDDDVNDDDNNKNDNDEEDEEFAVAPAKDVDKTVEASNSHETTVHEQQQQQPQAPFPNDGSFLAMMQQKLAEEQAYKKDKQNHVPVEDQQPKNNGNEEPTNGTEEK